MNSRRLLWGIVGIVVVGIFWVVSINNRLVTLDEASMTQWAQVENQLQRRYDLIPNLVNSVKGYASHESDVFKSIADARSKLVGAKTPNEKIAASQQMEGSLARLLVIAENYPNLKADQSFNRLMDELAGSENRISVERKRYNESVQAYNLYIKKFPNRFVVGFTHFTPKSYFELKNEAAKEAPKVQF
ncbi:LemA family protein [bacterium]|nr:LemA family protein [bacterium]